MRKLRARRPLIRARRINCGQFLSLDKDSYIFKAKSFLPSKFANSFTFVASDGARGGILTAWDPAYFSISFTHQDNHTLSTVLSSNISDNDIVIANVYAPSDHRDWAAFLSNLKLLPPFFLAHGS